MNWAEMGSQHTTARLDSVILGSGDGCSGRGDSGERLDSARALKFPNPGNENVHVKQYLNGLPEREDNVSLKLAEEILQSMKVGLAFRDYKGRISSLDYHKAASYVVTASDDESIRLYDVSTATCLKTINSKKYGVDLVCFTSHPTTVIYSSKNSGDELLRLLSLNDNKYLRYFRGHHDRVVSLSLCSRKECFISGSLDTTVLLWDQRAEKCQGLLRVRGRPVTTYDEQGKRSGPFNIFSVGGDMSDANVVRFSVLCIFQTWFKSSRCPESLNRAAAQNSRISGDGRRWDLCADLRVVVVTNGGNQRESQMISCSCVFFFFLND
ncbi:hypothetical protein OROHE_007976 [Orobanche hederae]